MALHRYPQAVGGGEGDAFFGEEEVVDEEEGEDGRELAGQYGYSEEFGEMPLGRSEPFIEPMNSTKEKKGGQNYTRQGKKRGSGKVKRTYVIMVI